MSWIIEWLVVKAAIIGAVCIAVVMGVMAYEVFCRYVLGSPTDWALEVSTYLFAASVTLGGAYTLRTHDHVGMELVYTMLPPRGRAIAQRISMLTILGFSLVLVRYGIEEVRTAALFNETSLTPLAMPLVYPLSLIPVGAALLSIQALELLIKPSLDLHLHGTELFE
jgi:TRAP-type C4-dicarboxylate transport system permease small subunit